MNEQKFQVIDGIECFTDHPESDNSYYPAEHFEWLHRIEDDHFWFKSRREILKSLYLRFADKTRPAKLLEIGCGTGGNLKMFSAFKNLELTGAEISLDYLRYIKTQLPDVKLAQIDATNLPYSKTFDAVCAFDVLEHIDDDQTAIRNVNQALKPGGLFFITVPQYQWMWSKNDTDAFHKRRYSKSDLINKLKASSFTITYSGSFVCALFPIMVLSRLIKGNKSNGDKDLELVLPKPLNAVFKLLMRLDIFLINRGLALPFGGSLVIVAKKS